MVNLGGADVKVSGVAHRGVELRVQEHGEDVLVYTFGAVAEAAEMFEFLRDFFPGARFVIQPLTH